MVEGVSSNLRGLFPQRANLTGENSPDDTQEDWENDLGTGENSPRRFLNNCSPKLASRYFKGLGLQHVEHAAERAGCAAVAVAGEGAAHGVDVDSVLESETGDDRGVLRGRVSGGAGLGAVQEHLGQAAIGVAPEAGVVPDTAVLELHQLMQTAIGEAFTSGHRLAFQKRTQTGCSHATPSPSACGSMTAG